MTDRRDEAMTKADDNVSRERAVGAPAALSRRAVLRGVTATVPTILTLSSGAALARSSNLIGTIQGTNGDVLCLKVECTQGPLKKNPNIYDLGKSPYAEVTRIPIAHNYRTVTLDATPQALTAPGVCKYTGEVEVQYNMEGEWQLRNRLTGVMVSNAAVASFGSRIVITDI